MANHKRDKVNSLSRNSLFPFTSILSPGGRGKGEGISSERGVALIAAVLAVTILMVIGLSFAFNMRLEEKAAVNFMNNVRAKQIAQAGIDKAIAELRTDADNYAYFCLARFPQPPTYSIRGYFSADTYDVTVRDTASMIHINDDNTGGRLENIMFALAEAIDIGEDGLDNDLPIGGADGRLIITDRPADGYLTKQQIQDVDITAAEFEAIKNYITVHTWVNPATGRAPVNVNTASDEVLEAVMLHLSDGTYTIDATDVAALIAQIDIRRPIRTWAEFNNAVDAAVTGGKRDVVKNNCNPNNAHVALDFRTTEFSFNSGGYFEIESTGRVYDLADDFAAESKIRAVVNIFNIWHQTTRAQFRRNTLRAVDATTRFYRVDYYDAAQLAHLLVETEEDSATYPDFNFSITAGTWRTRTRGGFDYNPFKLPSDDYRRRPFIHRSTATCRWNFKITDDRGLTGGSYDVFAWWYRSILNSFFVRYEYQIGTDGTTTVLAIRSQQRWWPFWRSEGRWNRLTRFSPLSFPVATTTPSFISIEWSFILLRAVADAMLLAAVDDVPGGHAGTMTATFSPTLSPGENVRLGTIAWTEIDVDYPRTDITFDVGISPLPPPVSEARGALTEPAGNSLLYLGTGTTISYRAYFSRTAGLPTPADPPILDDVTITYLPRTRILYWREVTE